LKISFFNLERQYEVLRDELEPAVLACLRAGVYIGGAEVQALEAELAAYLHVKHAITCANGTDALRLVLRALGVGAGDEVITTPFTFFATAEAIAVLGAVPVFVDIDPVSLNMNPANVEAAITPRTRAIMPVDIFGMPANMDAINAVAARHQLRVVEDAAQAIGAAYRGKMAGTLGDVGCFSFYPTKNLAAFGDGGMIATDDDNLAAVCRAIKAHGSGRLGAQAAALMGLPVEAEEPAPASQGDALYDPLKYYNYLVGDNSRLDTLQAAVLRVKLKHLDTFVLRRAGIAARYAAGLAGTPLQVPPMEVEGIRQCWHQYCVLAPDKDALTVALQQAQVGTGAFYPVPLHLQKAFRGLGYQAGSLPVAERVCAQSVCLPVFPELTEDEQAYIISTIHTHYGLL
jgi:dTDP-4-amino-4,6-dideoxygalactose transaminase